ncbi:hypothetical protein [Vibrio nereis]|uniref:hypothetical protein n=1 Tax=Vibrio nereis TaxID=693 RepID=UPI002494B602|nr:hypothetical protein [Vibrio nereis]
MKNTIELHRLFIIYSKTKTNNITELRNILDCKITFESKNDLKIRLIQLTPAISEVENLVPHMTKHDYICMINLIADLVFKASNTLCENEQEKLDKALSYLQSHIKSSRKDDRYKLSKQVKTNITEDEYSKLNFACGRFNYTSISHYLRDLIFNRVEVLPNTTTEFNGHFKISKKISYYLCEISSQDDCIEHVINNKEAAKEFASKMSELKRENDLTRNIVVDNHNKQTASIIALRHLSSDNLRKLSEEKLAKEKEADLDF